jgi:hypothetical protein
MKTNEAKEFLISRGYIFKGNKITAPDAEHPLDAISIQDELEDNFGMQLRYEGDILKLVKTDI